MKVFEDLVTKFEQPLPRKKDRSLKTTDWNDFNFPEFYPLIHYIPDSIKDPEVRSFVSVF